MKCFILILFPLTLTSLLSHAQHKLKIYGGKNHDQFLGCITCTVDDSSSIWFTLGKYGSTRDPYSIWNEKGHYGSKTSTYSPFNKKAKYPPIIIDENGRSYGYMTVNKQNSKRSWKSFVNMITDERDEIVKDIPEYYKENFHDFYN